MSIFDWISGQPPAEFWMEEAIADVVEAGLAVPVVGAVSGFPRVTRVGPAAKSGVHHPRESVRVITVPLEHSAGRVDRRRHVEVVVQHINALVHRQAAHARGLCRLPVPQHQVVVIPQPPYILSLRTVRVR